jgi:hypothetical protein
MNKLRLIGGTAATLFALLLTGIAQAGPVATDGTWYGFTWSGEPPNPTVGVARYALVDPVGDTWTYDSGPRRSRVTITDLEADIDYFELFDFGASVGLTPIFGSATSGCGGDPDACIAAGYSSATFILGPGSHSLSIVEVARSFGGTGAFKVEVSEPGTLALLGAGLFGLGWLRRRRSA